MLLLRTRRRLDAPGTGLLVGLVLVGLGSVAVYTLRREWLGPWLGGHLTNTVFVLLLVVYVGVAGLLVVPDPRVVPVVAPVVAAVTLLGALGFEASQTRQPGQGFDPVDALLSVVAAGAGWAVVACIQRAHMVDTAAPRDRRPGVRQA